MIRTIPIMLLLLAMTASPAEANSRWQLIYSSNFNGELKPCGCTTEGNLGGILRRATRLRELRQAMPVSLAVSAGNILGERDEQGAIKARYMLRAHERLSLDAILPGENDLAFGIDALKDHSLPWVLTNTTAETPFSRWRMKQVQNRTFYVFGILEASPLPSLSLTDPLTALSKALADAGTKPTDTVVVLVHGGSNLANSILALAEVDAVVRGPLKQMQKSHPHKGQAPLLAAGYRGQRLGHAVLDFSPKARLLQNTVETLPRLVKDSPDMIRLYKDYDQEITAWYRSKVAQRKKRGNEPGPYAGASTCGLCHQQAHKTWSNSRHARAQSSLVKAGKTEDPECLRCHNTGMGEKGGFISSEVTPALQNVQCESCHGSARAHAEYPLRHRPQSAMTRCKGCHTEENSPSFAFSRYWPVIAHGREEKIPVHMQRLSRVEGEYDLLDPERPLAEKGPVKLVEFFNFYCSRCYILVSNWPQTTSVLKTRPVHEEVPIILGEHQAPWAAMAYLVARQANQGEAFKRELFKAHFEDGLDLDDKAAISRFAARFGLDNAVRKALSDDQSAIAREYAAAEKLKNQYDVSRTPTLIINNNIRVTPKNTGDNTNLMLENVRDILLDLECRQTGAC